MLNRISPNIGSEPVGRDYSAHAENVRKAVSPSAKASSPASRPASSSGFNRSPIAKRPFERTISPRLLFLDAAWPIATRLSAIEVELAMT